MNSNKIKVGCQTYTWEMLGGGWQGSVDDILDAIAEAGYQGIEITVNVIGDYYYNNPGAFAEALACRKIELAAFAFASPYGFSDIYRMQEELSMASRAIDFAAKFPSKKLALGGATSPNREDYERKFQQACQIYNKIGSLAKDKGVSVNVHPHSHHGSLIQTAEEYDKLMQALDPILVSLGPDTGHIVRGGQNLIQTLKKHIKNITHIHFKDVDAEGNWRPLGEGICNFIEVLKLLEEVGYDGWVICEEESDGARLDPVGAIKRNRQYLKSLGYLKRGAKSLL